MYKQISANVRYTWGLIFVFIGLIIGLGFVFAQIYDNEWILILAIAISLIQTFISYYYSDKIALMATGAVPANRQNALELIRIVENLSITSGLPMPKVYLIPDKAPNAFATGRDPQHASLAVTMGLLEKLNKTELEGVVAHEMSHIKNYDIRLMSVVVVLVGAIALMADWFLRMGYFFGDDDNRGGSQWTVLIGILLAILAPISATLIQLAVSRRREFLADADGALLTRYPEGLANALEKISTDQSQTKLKNRATAHLFIASPFREDTKKSARESWLTTVFSTHPPIKERVKRLREMAR